MPEKGLQGASTGDALLVLGVVALASGLSMLAAGWDSHEGPPSPSTQPAARDLRIEVITARTDESCLRASMICPGVSRELLDDGPSGSVVDLPRDEASRNARTTIATSPTSVAVAPTVASSGSARSYILRTAARARYRWWNAIPDYFQTSQDKTRTVYDVLNARSEGATARPQPTDAPEEADR